MNSIEEYFLGTETLKEFRVMRNHYREYCENSNDDLLKTYKRIEKDYFWIGKVIPNVLSGLSLAFFFYTKDPICLLGPVVGETQRNLFNSSIKQTIAKAYRYIIPKRRKMRNLDDYITFNSSFESFVLDQEDDPEEQDK